ncbi:MAG: phosphomannomutase/phosphoglucomutase [Clostridiales bacterium]|nr:phosphomannomutase/phosphoglucomutase [Clostridiales bacterium]
MCKIDFLKLKSGTDVRGVALEGVEGESVNLTDEAIIYIVKAFLKMQAERIGKDKIKIAVGNDSRLSAPRILGAVKTACQESGCDLVYTGLSSTPSMFMLLKNGGWDCDASIMITASHLPFNRNGLKFFTPEGGLESSDITELLHIAEKGEFLSGNGSYEEKSFIDEYCADLVSKVTSACGEKPLLGKRIIVDAGNGAGGFFVEKVLIPLGADTEGSQFLQPDGSFPNHIPNPEDKVAMKAICDAVIKNKADLGIIFDTDVDRAAVVDPDGKEVNRNKLIALISAILLKEKQGTIVTDSVTSDGLAKFIKEHGGKHLRFKRGYKNVIGKSVELNESGEYSPLAIETSGHAALKENYFLDDGAYLVTRILIGFAEQAKKGENLFDLIKDLHEAEEEVEIRLNFDKGCDFKLLGALVIEDIKKAVVRDEHLTLANDNYEGVRINFDDTVGNGWALVRMSVHDPIMPINIESDSVGGTKVIAQKLYDLLKGYTFLNAIKIKSYINE